MTRVNSKELNLMDKLMSRAYDSSARSFEKIARSPIYVKNSELKVTQMYDYNTIRNIICKNNKSVMVKTEIIGELGGASFLLLSDVECKKIYEASLMKGYTYGSSPEIETAMITELDNILSAAVITEFANFLQVSLYGDVPHYLRKDSDALADAVVDELINLNMDGGYFLFTNTHFSFAGDKELNPIFFWHLDEGFIEAIENKKEEVTKE